MVSVHGPGIYKEVNSKGGPIMRWVPMGKSIANIYRYAQVSAASNKRYLDSLADAIPTGEINEIPYLRKNTFKSSFLCIY